MKEPARGADVFQRAATLFALAGLTGLCAGAGAGAAPVSPSPAAGMKAVVAHTYGEADLLKVENIPVPQPNYNDMLVRVIASGVNPADPLILSGKYAKEFGSRLPLVLGYDMAGVVEQAGAGITKFKPGDAVYAYLLFGGGWAEHVITNENEAALKPKSLSFVDAAAVPLAALTAWQALVETADLQPGQTVLVHGGSGGVGSFAIQIAKSRGARVIATASTANQELLKQLGADVTIDYTKTRFEDIAKDVDVVIDPIGKDTLARSYAVVKKGGLIVTLVSRPDPQQLKEHEIRGQALASHPEPAALDEISKLIEAGKIKPVVTEVLPLEEANKACAQAETHHTRGKIVLRIAPDAK